MLIILWTDALVFGLAFLSIIMIVIAARNQEMRSKWRKAYARPSRMIAMISLIFFALLGLLDSMHYVNNNFTTASGSMHASVLDYILQPISTQTESTYSAPFATNLFVKEMVKDIDDQITWVSPKLQHVNPVAVWPCLLLSMAGLLFAWLMARKNIAIMTLSVILIISASCGYLMQHYHILGTDKIGIDVFYASLKSIRTALIIGTLTTIITLPFAVLFGSMAGYLRGWVDDLIQYIYITISSIPSVLLIAALMLSLDTVVIQHADARLLLLCAVLGITSWTSLCRILRAETLKLRNQEYILAAKVAGLSNIRIITKHVLPNLFHIILIALVLDFSGLVLAESVLSYIGVGVDASMFSWGNMINSARMEMARDPIVWWSLMGAFVFMFILVLAANIFGDGVRMAFDPRSEDC